MAARLLLAESGSSPFDTAVGAHTRRTLRDTLRLSPHRFDAGPPPGQATVGRIALLCCALEPRLQRYLLTGAVDGCVTLCDTHAATARRTTSQRHVGTGAATAAGPVPVPAVPPVLRLPRAHRFS